MMAAHDDQPAQPLPEPSLTDPMIERSRGSTLGIVEEGDGTGR